VQGQTLCSGPSFSYAQTLFNDFQSLLCYRCHRGYDVLGRISVLLATLLFASPQSLVPGWSDITIYRGLPSLVLHGARGLVLNREYLTERNNEARTDAQQGFTTGSH
jgi:hypothetical protein